MRMAGGNTKTHAGEDGLGLPDATVSPLTADCATAAGYLAHRRRTLLKAGLLDG